MNQSRRIFGYLLRNWRRLPRRVGAILVVEGWRGLRERLDAVLRRPSLDYAGWIRRYDTPAHGELERVRGEVAAWKGERTISMIMPVFRGELRAVERTMRSLQAQLYPGWELCLSIDAKVTPEEQERLGKLSRKDRRLRVMTPEPCSSWSSSANLALSHAGGEFVALIDPGDALSRDAIYWIIREITAVPEVSLIFSDEDKIAPNGIRSDPWFKSDWNPALMLSHNAVGRLAVHRRSVIEQLGGFRQGFEGSECYDLILRCSVAGKPGAIRHISRILYHRGGVRADRSGASAEGWEAGRRAILEHLATQGISAKVRRNCENRYQVEYTVSSPCPRVSIILATTARPTLIDPCLNALEQTTYAEIEILLLVNETHRELLQKSMALKRLMQSTRVRVLTYADMPFNYSWVNNWGAGQASGELLCFLNDDTEVITPGWLEQLVARVQVPRVAAVGAMLYYPDHTIQHAGVILGLGGVAGHACVGEPRGTRGYFDRGCLEQDVSCLTAACILVRGQIFRELQGFDETMPVAYNDVDLCIRMRQAGWRLIWTPTVEVIHRESASLGRHDLGERARQFSHDLALMRQRWASVLDADPFYNRNLSLERAYELAFPPR